MPNAPHNKLELCKKKVGNFLNKKFQIFDFFEIKKKSVCENLIFLNYLLNALPKYLSEEN